jgi:hypothetical protein
VTLLKAWYKKRCRQTLADFYSSGSPLPKQILVARIRSSDTKQQQAPTSLGTRFMQRRNSVSAVTTVEERLGAN